jgi:hypothetical protein
LNLEHKNKKKGKGKEYNSERLWAKIPCTGPKPIFFSAAALLPSGAVVPLGACASSCGVHSTGRSSRSCVNRLWPFNSLLVARRQTRASTTESTANPAGVVAIALSVSCATDFSPRSPFLFPESFTSRQCRTAEPTSDLCGIGGQAWLPASINLGRAPVACALAVSPHPYRVRGCHCPQARCAVSADQRKPTSVRCRIRAVEREERKQRA